MAFWFAVHLEDVNICKHLVHREFLLKQMVACALMNKYGEDQKQHHSEEDSEEGEEEWNINSGANSVDSFRSEEISDQDRDN